MIFFEGAIVLRNCPGCGAQLSDESNYCEYCGADVRRRLENTKPEPQMDSGTDERAQKNTMPPAGRVRLKKVSPTLMGILTLVTFFLYPSIWLLLRQKTFDEMSSEVKVGILLPCLLLGAAVLSAVISSDSNLLNLSHPDFQRETWKGYLFFASLILSTILTFRLRRILRSYAARMDPSPFAANLVARSVLWSVLLQFFYIQHSITLLIESGLVYRKGSDLHI